MLNPLTCTEIYEACVVSVCLYGLENWILTEQLLEPLEKFQAEIGKRILNLPKQHSNLTHLITMRWPSMRLRVLKRKLKFLTKLAKAENCSISSQVFHSLLQSGTEPLVVQQCKFLEQVYNTSITQKLLKKDENEYESLFYTYDMLEKADYERILSLMKSKVSLRYLQKDIPWMKLWDLARDYGAHGSRAIQAVIKVLTTPSFSD